MLPENHFEKKHRHFVYRNVWCSESTYSKIMSLTGSSQNVTPDQYYLRIPPQQAKATQGKENAFWGRSYLGTSLLVKSLLDCKFDPAQPSRFFSWQEISNIYKGHPLSIEKGLSNVYLHFLQTADYYYKSFASLPDRPRLWVHKVLWFLQLTEISMTNRPSLFTSPILNGLLFLVTPFLFADR